jgi:hypothetical protein
MTIDGCFPTFAGYILALPIFIIRGEAAVVIDSSAVIHRLDHTALADASKFYRYL